VGKSKNDKLKDKRIIDMSEVFIHSGGKRNRSEDVIKTGCGPHKSPKDYKRKPKHQSKEYGV